MTSSGLKAPAPITGFHKAVGEEAFRITTRGFDCGVPELNTYLEKFALQNHRNDSAKCYVATRGESCIGYYCLTSASLSHEDVPERVSKGLARHEVPAILLARLAVHRTEQHRGIGASLLRDAFVRTCLAAEIVACRILIVHAKDEQAARFYASLDFQPIPATKRHLYLLLKDLRKIIKSA